MNVLFVGNSYTYYHEMPEMLAALCRENGKDVAVFSVTKGGRHLYEYQNDDDPITKRFYKLLAEREYDVCFLQEQSLLPAINPDRFMEGVAFVHSKLPSAAKRILYATWARKEGCEALAEHSLTKPQMHERLTNAYLAAADMIGARVSPVGTAFQAVLDAECDLELYMPDGSHPSPEGSALAALVHYHTLFGQFPEHAESLPLSPELLAAFLPLLLPFFCPTFF